jgi:hypothetical protein
LNTKSQMDFDCLRQPHILDETEKDKDMSWECCKVVEYCKQKWDVDFWYGSPIFMCSSI